MKKNKLPKDFYKTKRWANNLHFKKRALSRYGLVLSTGDVRNMVKMIEQSKFEFMEQRTNTRSYVRLVYMDKLIHLIYDKRHKNFVTALPIEGE